jgi:hypothetical protein
MNNQNIFKKDYNIRNSTQIIIMKKTPIFGGVLTFLERAKTPIFGGVFILYIKLKDTYFWGCFIYL